MNDDLPPTWPAGFVASTADRAALPVLLGMASLTPRRLLAVAARRGSAAACLAAVRSGADGSRGDREHAARTDPVEVSRRVAAAGARLVAVEDPEYPLSLLDLFDPPAGLFVRGRPLEPDAVRVSIVGARNCSPSGREMAVELGRAASAAGVEVVSGAARGVDAASHEGALLGGGRTVAVLGSGIDVAYPPRNQTLVERVAAVGTVVSEYPPGTPAEPFRFPARNRIVAALGLGVVVVEGAEGSGSMITADHALEIGREVFAVPGPVTSPLAAVPLALIREGATLIRGPGDLLADLGVTGPEPGTDRGLPGAGPQEPEPAPGGSSPSGDVRRVWQGLASSIAPDLLARSVGLPLPTVLRALLDLELRGLVRQVGGRWERRIR